MVCNVSNSLKKKIINNSLISRDEAISFIEYMISKTKLIVDRMYNKNYNYMYLFCEVALSYNLMIREVRSRNICVIIDIGGFKYLVDMNFNNNIFSFLYDNKYIDYNEENYLKYMDVCGDIVE